MTLTKTINIELIDNNTLVSILNQGLERLEKIFFYDYLSDYICNDEKIDLYTVKVFYLYLVEFCLNHLLDYVLKKNKLEFSFSLEDNNIFYEIKIEKFDSESNVVAINDILQARSPKIYSTIIKNKDILEFVSRFVFLGRYEIEIILKLKPIKRIISLENNKELKNYLELQEGHIKANNCSMCIFKGKILKENDIKLQKLKYYMYILSRGLIDELEKIGKEEILKKFFNIDSLTRYDVIFRLKLTNNIKHVPLDNVEFSRATFFDLVNKLSDSWKSQYENIEYNTNKEEKPFNKLKEGSKKIVSIQFKSKTSSEELKIIFNLIGKTINPAYIKSPQQMFSEIRKNRLLINIEFTLPDNKKYKINFVPKDISELYTTLCRLFSFHTKNNIQNVENFIKTNILNSNICDLSLIKRAIPYTERSTNNIILNIIENDILLNSILIEAEIKKIIKEDIKDIEYREDKNNIEIVFETKSYCHFININYNKVKRKLFFEWCIKKHDKIIFNLYIPFEVIVL